MTTLPDIIEFVDLGVQGPRGAMMLSGNGAPSAGLGQDGDTYIDRLTGEIWARQVGAWADTGANIFGTIPADAAAARDVAVAAAIDAGNAALAAGNSATAAATSATNAANSAAAALASKNAAGTSETNAAGSAAAALASKNAAGTSETNAADSAAAALASKNAAATSETNAAASAAAAQVAKINWRGLYAGATAYAVRDAVYYNGSSWIAKAATTGNAPPALPATSNTWWELAAQRGDVYQEFGVSVAKAAGIDLAGYYADRSSISASTLAKLYAEIISGGVGAWADMYLAVNGAMAFGPVTVALGAPVDLTGLAIVVPAGAKVAFVVTAMGGGVTEFFAKTYGAAS